MLFGGGFFSTTRVFHCVCSLHACVICALLLGQVCGSCEWVVLVTVALCQWLPWGILYLSEVLPAIAPHPTGGGAGAGVPALIYRLVTPPTAVCVEEVGLILSVY